MTDSLKVPLHTAGPGHFVAESVSVPIAGLWTLDIHVRTTEIDVYSADLPLIVKELSRMS